MKVVFDHEAFSFQRYGGIPRYVSTLYHHLPDAGVQTQIATRFVATSYVKDDFLPIVPPQRWRWLNRKMWHINRSRSKRVIARGKYDVLHSSFWNPFLLDAKAKAGRPMVVTIHDLILQAMPEIFGGEQPHLFEWHELMIPHVDKFIAISEYTKRDFLRFYDVDPARIEVVHHGLMIDAPAQAPRRSVTDKPYLLYVGDRINRKNYEYFIREAVPVARSYGLDIVCTGGGAFKPHEQAWIAAAGGTGIVHQTGVSDGELAWLYAHAVCHVYPSYYEGFGLPILEAFAQRCPQILADATCFPEIGADAALYFDPHGRGALDAALRRMLDDPGLRASLAEKGEQRLQEHFTLRQMIDRTADVYRSMI